MGQWTNRRSNGGPSRGISRQHFLSLLISVWGYAITQNATKVTQNKLWHPAAATLVGLRSGHTAAAALLELTLNSARGLWHRRKCIRGHIKQAGPSAALVGSILSSVRGCGIAENIIGVTQNKPWHAATAALSGFTLTSARGSGRT
jgi:hypothetical protein